MHWLPAKLSGLLAIVLVAGVGCATTTRRGAAPPVPLVSFVFDDGYDTDYWVARGIFAEHRAVACSAITTDWIGKRDHLTVDQILALRDDGWEIMGHTASHPLCRRLLASKSSFPATRMFAPG